MIRIAIVEDERLFMEQLQDYIHRYEKESGRQIRITTFADGEDITENYRGEFDIILMDIQMRFMDGMTAAEKIRRLDQEVIIMFITNMVQYAVRGYEVDAMDYVLKPVEYFAFSQKLEKAIGRMNKAGQEFVMVATEAGMQKLSVSEIYYIESQGHYARYRLGSGEVTSRITLKELEEAMCEHGFFRCGKGYLVNMRHVDGIVGGDCMIHGEQIPISRNKKKEFMELLIQYINEG
ncbi:MAG: LytTR family DNA-binding domain-containing protein [Lachnospiraceae bacterium]|nr:LytTR family DNA-binding domain-containing protein [Lachnospiraceae bacterium]